MDKYKQFEALMKCADFRRNFRQERRAFEWRMRFAVWALMVGLATTIKSYPVWLLLIMVILIVVFDLIWASQHYAANQRDANFMWEDYDAAREIVELKFQEPPPNKIFVRQHNPVLSASYLTIILGVALVALKFSVSA